MKRGLILCASLACTISLYGCGLGVLVAGVGYASSSNKSANAKNIEAKTQASAAYSSYRVEMEKLNLEREKQGLQPVAIQDFAAWSASTNMPAVAEKDEAKKNDTDQGH